MQLVGDASPPMNGEVSVDAGSLVVLAGGHELGTWPMEQLAISRRPDGFHIGAEGEELVFKADDPIAFASAVGLLDKAAPAAPSTAEPPPPKRSYRELKQLAALRSKQKWLGVAALAFLVLAIFLRELLAGVLVVVAGIGVLVAAVAMVEPLVAAKFPGKLTPIRVLIGSTVVLLAGIVLAAI